MERKQNYLKDLIYILIGNLIVACGVSFFVLPNNILTGGGGVPVLSVPGHWEKPAVFPAQHRPLPVKGPEQLPGFDRL